jgi:hypothetical protein
VALLISGLSCAYVGRYGLAAAQIAACIASGAAFLMVYAKYLDRLEVWAGSPEVSPSAGQAVRPDMPASTAVTTSGDGGGKSSSREPLPTSVIVALATAAYGPVLIGVGLFGHGSERTYNLIAGGAFLLAAAIVWFMGRRSDQDPAPVSDIVSPELAGSQADLASLANAPRCNCE